MSGSLGKAQEKLAQAVDNAARELRRVCLTIDHSSIDLDFADVVVGMLARQYQLWAALVLGPSAWTTAGSPLMLRGLVDGTITLSWITKSPESARQFKLYSAGRFKLLAEHVKARQGAETDAWQSTYAKQLQELADSELWTAVLPVELSNWNDKDIRTMAIEADLKDLYDLAYSPLSADVHAEWMILRTKYLRRCEEPLHKSHWLPVFERPYLDLRVPVVATWYFRSTIDAGVKALSLRNEQPFWDEIEECIANACRIISDERNHSH